MKAKIYVGAKKYALYIGRKIVQKTLEFLTLPVRFISKKVQELKNLTMWGESVQNGTPTPTNPIEIESVGDRTKNLFNPNVETYNGYIKSSSVGNIISFSSSDLSKSYLKIAYLKRGTYCYSFDNSPISGDVRVCICDDDRIIRYTIALSMGEGYNEAIFTTNVDGWLYITTLVGSDSIQIEEGDTATSYEPYGYKIPVAVNDSTTNIYLNEPLRKIGEYADTLSVDGNKVIVTRNIESYNATKLTNLLQYYGLYATHNLWYFDTGVTVNNKEYDSTAPLSNILKGLSSTEATGSASELPNFGIRYQFSSMGSNINRAYFNYDGISTISDMLNKLNELQVEIIKILFTPTTETYTIENPIQLEQGTLTIDTSTNIKPSKIEITGDIDNE